MSILESAERLQSACVESNRICAEILVTIEQQRLAGEERMRRMTAMGAAKEAGHTPTLTVVNGHYPGFRELHGLDFPVSAVLSATDVGWDKGQLREQQLQRLALAWNSFDALTEANASLLALARQYASECAQCGGTGLVTIHNYDGHGSDADDQFCPQCEDIHAVLAKAAP